MENGLDGGQESSAKQARFKVDWRTAETRLAKQ
jgi:hypothetical protein